MDNEGDWRAELDRWLEPFLAELNHAARRTMCPHYVAGGPSQSSGVDGSLGTLTEFAASRSEVAP